MYRLLHLIAHFFQGGAFSYQPLAGGKVACLCREARRKPSHSEICPATAHFGKYFLDHSNTTVAMFSPEEIERYARHIVLHGIGGPGQQKLKAARVLVIGAGGLGSPLIQYLAAAGVGEIGIIDDDEVSLSNLQRQVLHGTPDIGRAKVDSASAAIAQIEPARQGHRAACAAHGR